MDRLMPIRTITTSPDHRVIIRTCDGCGSHDAPYGTGSIREALRTGDPSRVKCWCGPDGCAKATSQEKAA